MNLTEYQSLINNTSDAYKDTVVTPIKETGVIKQRFIASETSDYDKWLNALRMGKVNIDIWMISFNLFRGLNDNVQPSQLSINKPVNFSIDYASGYKVGTDNVNSENEFNEKMIALDFQLEKHRRCLLEDCSYEIEDWVIRTSIKTFKNGAIHFGRCDIKSRYKNISFN